MVRSNTRIVLLPCLLVHSFTCQFVGLIVVAQEVVVDVTSHTLREQLCSKIEIVVSDIIVWQHLALDALCHLKN